MSAAAALDAQRRTNSSSFSSATRASRSSSSEIGDSVPGDPLVQPLEVRARVRADREPIRPQKRGAQPRRRALAVRTGDVDDGEGLLGLAHRARQRGDPLEGRERRTSGDAALDRLEVDVAVEPGERVAEGSVRAPGRAAGRAAFSAERSGRRTARPVGLLAGAARHESRSDALEHGVLVDDAPADVAPATEGRTSPRGAPLRGSPRRPRAPVPRSSAWSATASRASSVISSSTPSSSKTRWYCLTRAFFGSTRMRTSASWSRFETAPSTGSRPTNSGMSPNFKRSSGSTSWRRRDSSSLRGTADLGSKADPGASRSATR